MRIRRTASLAVTLLVPVLFAPALAAQLTIHVTQVPPDTPPNATLYVAGTFNGWTPGAASYALARGADGTYALRLPGSVRGPVAFKLTRGSWATVETTALGADVPNRAYTVPATGAATLDVAVGGWRTTAPPGPVGHTASPSVHILAVDFPIPQLGRTRRVWLYLPPGYATSRTRYPVLYMQDGQNVFDAATSFAGEWRVDESLDSLAARGDAGAIVVAVDNDGAHRLDEYDPWKAVQPQYGGGEGDAYVRFLAYTLKPYIDAHYRTRPDRLNTGVLGSSMGGLIALYAALAYPEVFGRAGVFSCACWIARPDVDAFARAAKPPSPPTRFYFVVGARETADGEPARDQQTVVDALRAAGFPDAAIVSRVVPDGTHAESFWRREFPAAYAWMFGVGAVRPGVGQARRARP